MQKNLIKEIKIGTVFKGKVTRIIQFGAFINLINKTEKYDGRISVSNYYDCGDICSKTIGCAGFAYNDNNKCYISKTPINPLPLPALYSNEYKTTNTYCNKFKYEPSNSNTQH